MKINGRETIYTKRNKASKILSFLLIVVAVFVLVACTNDKDDDKDAKPDVTDENGEGPSVNKERLIRLAGGFWPAPPGFGGNLIGAQVGDPGSYIYESLFMVIVGTDKVVPRLAKEWEHNGNLTTVDLWDNRSWSDGTKFTAKDMWSYYLINIDSSGINRHLEEIKVVDEYTMEFVWAEPVVSDAQKMLFLAEGWQAVTPYHIFGEYVDEVEAIMEEGQPYDGGSKRRPPFGLVFTDEQSAKLKDLYNDFKNVDMEMPIGTGPYMVDKVSNVQVDLVPNPYFPESEKFEFQKLRMHTVADYNSLLASGGTDLFIGTLPYDMSRNILDSNKDMVMYPLLEQKSIGVIFNTDIQPLNDKRVRQAFNELINKKPVREVANYWAVENDVATTGLVPSSLDKYISPDVNAKITRYSGDADKAARMLEDIGWSRNKDGKWQDPTGRTYKLIIAANGGWGAQGISAATEIAQQLTAFGIDTEAKAVEATVVVSNMKEGAYDMLIDYIDLTWNISDPYKCFTSYYGEVSDKASLDLTDLVLEDYDGKEINIEEAVESLRYIDDEEEYSDLVGRLAWATNDNAIGINLYQNVMAVWISKANITGLPMEDEFDEYDRMMPLARTPEEYEDIAVLNRAYAAYGELFIRNQVKPR